MATWAEFAAEAPALAAFGERRFAATGLALIGTLRADGWPRISPVEPLIEGGALYLGMMLGSRKARDLQRDPRCVVHSTVADRDGGEGEFKAYGRAIAVDADTDGEELARYVAAVTARNPQPPPPAFHLFRLEIAQASTMHAEPTGAPDRLVIETWRPGRAVTRVERR